MTVTFMCGFEGQSAGADSYTITGTASASTTQHRTGAASLRCNPASGTSGYGTVSASLGSGYIHFGLYVATLPSTERLIYGQNNLGTINVRLSSTGTLQAYLQNGNLGSASSAIFASPGWHWVGVRMVTGTGVDWLQIDGVAYCNEPSAITVTTRSSVFGCWLTEASAIDVYIDDLIHDNAGFLAASNVDTALPISDNSRTAVTTNSGGTTNLWDCVNNTPPAGVASANEAAAGAVSILFPASATESYAPNLETYTTLGITAADTILAVQSVIRHGEDVATGTKNGTLGAVTNPTISDSLAFTFGDDSGAHGAEAGLWVTKFGTLTTSPSVTLGTSPTLTVSRASESRVGCIDYMGLLVAWTPSTAAHVPRNPVVNFQDPGIL